MKTVAKLNVRFYITAILLAGITVLLWYSVYFFNAKEILTENGAPMVANEKLIFTTLSCLVGVSWTVSLITMIRQICLGYAYTADKSGIYNTLTAVIIFAFIFVVPIKEIPRSAILEIKKEENEHIAKINKSEIVIFRPFRLFARKKYHFFRGFTNTPAHETAALFKKYIPEK